jgi:hypothetical protein
MFLFIVYKPDANRQKLKNFQFLTEKNTVRMSDFQRLRFLNTSRVMTRAL